MMMSARPNTRPQAVTKGAFAGAGSVETTTAQQSVCPSSFQVRGLDLSTQKNVIIEKYGVWVHVPIKTVCLSVGPDT